MPIRSPDTIRPGQASKPADGGAVSGFSDRARPSVPERDRVLFITRNFPPLVGGAERLCAAAAEQIGGRWGCDVVGPPGCAGHLGAEDDGFETPLSPLGHFLLAAFWRSLLLARSKRHRLVLAGSGLMAPIALGVGRAFGLPTIAFAHGLDLAVKNPVYRSLWIASIRRLNLVIANSRFTAHLAERRGVSPSKIEILHPPLALVRPRQGSAPPELPPRGWPGPRRQVLLFVGRIVPRKGLIQLVDRTLPALVKARPEVALVVIGDSPDQALRGYPEPRRELAGVVRDRGLERNVFLLGRVCDENLRYAYARSRALLLPLVDVPGDIEGFGMVAVEAAAHGLPTVAFSLGGIVDAVGEGRSGLLIPPGDYDLLTRTLKAVLAGTVCVPSAESCRGFASRFSLESYSERLLTLCERTVRSHFADRGSR